MPQNRTTLTHLILGMLLHYLGKLKIQIFCIYSAYVAEMQTYVCGKTADRIRMPFGTLGRTGPGMRQVVGFGIGPREGVLLGRIWGAPL